MWENVVDPGRQPMIIWHMCVACWVTKAEDTHSEYVISYLLRFHGNNVCTNVPQCYVIPYPTAFPYGNGMVLHFYQQQESSTTKTVHRVINKGLKAYV